MADPASTIAARYGNSLPERKFDFQQEQAQEMNNLRQLQEARAQALAEKTLAVEAAKLHRQTQADLDAADFLKHWQGVQPNDPEYENKREQLLALYPFAGHDDTVKASVQDRNATRSTYMEATKSGGAYDLPEGPARNEFHKIFGQTGDLNAAKAAGRTIAEDEKEIRAMLKDGHLSAADFARVEGAPLPPTFNSDGSINYRQAKLIGSERAGKTTGAQAKAEDADLRAAQAYVTSYLSNAAKMIEEDPGAKELYQLYSKKLLSAARGSTGTTPAPAAAASLKAITTQAEYEALPPGAPFDFNGRKGRKPAK